MFFAWKSFADLPESCLWCSLNHPRVWVHIALEASHHLVTWNLSSPLLLWLVPLHGGVCANKSVLYIWQRKLIIWIPNQWYFWGKRRGLDLAHCFSSKKGKYLSIQIFFYLSILQKCISDSFSNNFSFAEFICSWSVFYMVRKSDHQYSILLLKETVEVSLSSLTWFNWIQVLVEQSCLTLCGSMYCSLLGSYVHGIFQARILDWVAIPFCRGSSWLRVWIWVSRITGSLYRLSHQGSKSKRLCLKSNGHTEAGLGPQARPPDSKPILLPGTLHTGLHWTLLTWGPELLRTFGCILSHYDIVR